MVDLAKTATEKDKAEAFEWLRSESTAPWFGDVEPLHNFHAGVLLYEIGRLKDIEQRYNRLTQKAAV